MVNKNTWREKTISLAAGIVQPYFFNDTQPNVLQLKQDGVGVVSVSQNRNVDTNSEVEINDTNWVKYVHPQGLKVVWFVSSSDCTLMINSAEVDNLQISDLNATQKVEGILWVASIQGELPAGNNDVGIFHITDGTDALGINTDGSINVRVNDGFHDLALNTDGSLTTSIKCAVNNNTMQVESDGSINTNILAGTALIGKVKISDGITDASINTDGTLLVTNIPSTIVLPLKVAIGAGSSVTVKATAGHVIAIQTALTDLLCKNNTTEVWKGNYSGSTPFYCSISIVLSSVTGGDAYIVYR